MYSCLCLGIARNILSVRAHAVNYLPRQFLQKPRPHWEHPPHPHSNILQHFKTDSFFISNLAPKIIILWFCLNSWWIGCLILVFRSREHPHAVLYTQIVRTHPISAKTHRSEAVYFLILNDVSGICSRYIILVWTHSKFTFTHMCKSTHVQICTPKQFFAVWMGLKCNIYSTTYLHTHHTGLHKHFPTC